MKILCVLYDDPVNGMPDKYARDDLPKLDKYPDGMSLPSPSSVDFTPGQLLGCVSGELGLRKFLEDAGHTLVVTSDKDGEGCQACLLYTSDAAGRYSLCRSRWSPYH